MGRPKPVHTGSVYERRECPERTTRKISGGKAAKKKSAEVEYDICGCCPAGLVVYPESIEDILMTDCHNVSRENFKMFLRKQKDQNTDTEMQLKLKHEQRMSFAILTARIGKFECKYYEKLGSYALSKAGKRFSIHSDSKWPDDLLEGFDEAEALIAHLKDLANDSGLQDLNDLSNDSIKAVKKDLVDSAYNWVVEQLDAALVEFKEFRGGLEENEREKWDKLVVQLSVKGSDFASFGKELHKEMDDIIARYNNQNKDIDSLVELIEGKSLGAVPKKKKEKISKSRQKNNPDIKRKDDNKHAEIENESEGNLISQQNPFEDKSSEEIVSEIMGEKIESSGEHLLLEKTVEILVSMESGDKKDALINKLEPIQKEGVREYQIDEVLKDNAVNGQNLIKEVKKDRKRDKVSKPNCALASCQNKGRHKCARCKAVFYCAQKCLDEDWPHHKMFCDYVFEANKVPVDSTSIKSSEIENSGRDEVD